MNAFFVSHENILGKITQYIFLSCLLVVTGWFLYYDFLIIQTPIQLEFREGSILATTELLLRGQNPYDKANQPLYTNVYGTIYNLAVVPFAAVFGNTLWVHRFITGLSIFASAVLLSMTLIKKRAAPLLSISAGVLFLSCQYFFINALSRPDGLGLLFFLLSIFIPWNAEFNKKSLFAGGLVGILAFYTKPYFVLGLVYIAVYLFLFVSKKKAFGFGVLTLFLFLLSLWFVWETAPYYFYNVVFIHYSYATRDWLYMLLQVGQFFTLFGVVFLWSIIIGYKKKDTPTKTDTKTTESSRRFANLKRIDINHFDRPVLDVFLDLPVFCFFFSFLLIFFSLGLHIGNYMVYLFQLMAPFFTMMMVQRLSRINKFPVLTYMAIVLNAFLIMKTLYPLGLDFDPAIYQAGWPRVRQLIAEHNTILNSPALVSELISQKKPFMNTGQNEYFYVPSVPDVFFLPASNEIYEIGNAFREEIIQSVQNKSYDLVMYTPTDPFLTNTQDLQRNYRHVETITLAMPVSKQVWEVEVWLPK